MNKNEKSIYNHNTTLAINVKCLCVYGANVLQTYILFLDVRQNVRHQKPSIYAGLKCINV